MKKPELTSENLHRRHSIRLQGYDYSQPGAYFITTVIHARRMILGKIEDGEMQLAPQGKIVRQTWLDLTRHYPGVQLDTFCIMPNHFHGIIVIIDSCRGGSSLSGKFPLHDGVISGKDRLQTEETRPYSPVHMLPEIVRAFKSFSARRINALTNTAGTPVWQRNYFEHIIRNDTNWNQIRAYILDNIRRWEEDVENPAIQKILKP